MTRPDLTLGREGMGGKQNAQWEGAGKRIEGDCETSLKCLLKELVTFLVLNFFVLQGTQAPLRMGDGENSVTHDKL